jgi:hypothetical protein
MKRIRFFCVGVGLIAGALNTNSFTDDFERFNDVPPTKNGSLIGSGWQIGDGLWGIENTVVDGYLIIESQALLSS